MSSSLRPADRLWESELDVSRLPFLADHQVHGAIILPGAAYLEMALAAGREALGGDCVVLEDFEFREPLRLDGRPVVTQAGLLRDDTQALVFRFSSRRPATDASADGSWLCHASGRVDVLDQTTDAGVAVSLDAIVARCGDRIDAEAFYAALDRQGLSYGPAFRGVEEIWRGNREAIGRVRLAPSLAPSPYAVHPALLDSAFHVLAAGLADLSARAGKPFIPVGVGRVRLRAPVGPACWCHARVRVVGASGGEHVEGDVQIVDEQGRVLVEVEDLRLHAADIVAPRLDPADDRLIDVVWRAAAPAEPVETGRPTRGWLIVGGDEPLRAGVARRLEALGHAVAVSDTARAAIEVVAATSAALDGVVFIASDGAHALATAEDVQRTAARHCSELLDVAKWLVETEQRASLWIVTKGVHGTPLGGPADDNGLVQAPLWGLARTLTHEHPNLRSTCVDVSVLDVARASEALVGELVGGSLEQEVALRPDGRHVGRLEWAQAGTTALGSSVALDPAAAYVVTGGLGGLGLAAAGWLVDKGARHVVLIGRRGAETPAQANAVEGLRGRGADVRVVQGDIAATATVASALADLRRNGLALRGVIHAAGVLDDGIVLEQTRDRVHTVMGPKVGGAWNLHQQTAGEPIDFFVLYSAGAALLGSPGQANYAAANSFLDALAYYRRGLGLPAVSIDWGAFSRVGLAAAADSRGARLGHQGLKSLTPEEGLAVLERVLVDGRAQVGAIPIDVRQWLEVYPRIASSSRLAPLLAGARAAGPAVGPDTQFLALLRARPEGERQRLLAGRVVEVAAQVLRFDATRIDRDAPFKTLGFDSLMGLELRNRLEGALRCTLPATLVWTYPTVNALAEHLAGKVAGASAVAKAPVAAARPDSKRLEALEKLDDVEAEALLRARLASLEEHLT